MSRCYYARARVFCFHIDYFVTVKIHHQHFSGGENGWDMYAFKCFSAVETTKNFDRIILRLNEKQFKMVSSFLPFFTIFYKYIMHSIPRHIFPTEKKKHSSAGASSEKFYRFLLGASLIHRFKVYFLRLFFGFEPWPRDDVRVYPRTDKRTFGKCTHLI